MKEGATSPPMANNKDWVIRCCSILKALSKLKLLNLVENAGPDGTLINQDKPGEIPGMHAKAALIQQSGKLRQGGTDGNIGSFQVKWD